jgi:predicted Holliday junction resolvase-like endonuclease
MRKINFEDDEPLIHINWRKLWRYCKRFVGAIIWTIKKIIKTIAKTILEILILLMRGFLWTYKKFKQLIKAIFLALKKFSKKNIKGFWLLLVIAIFLIISLFSLWKGYAYAQGIIHNLKETKDVLQKQQEHNIKLFEENEQLKEEIEDKDKKLKAKAEEQAKYARQQWILKNRQAAEQKLPEEVKTTITKYANAYGVKDTRLVQCIVYHESGGRDEAVGDNGKAVGVAQYHLATFLGHRKQMGLSQVDLRKDTNASIQCMVFSISRGGISNWTARTKCI